MKKKTLMMGILGILLVFSLTFTACSSGGDDSNTSNVSADFTPTALQSGLTLSAQKNNDTGVITVTLRGTISQPGDFEAQFSPGGPDKPAGNYAYVNFSLASVIMPVADEVIAIRQDNDALRYYANTDTAAGNLLATEPSAPIFAGAEPNIYVPDAPAMPLKWKANASNDFDENAAGNCPFIVSSAASPKVITIDLTTWSANTFGATKTGDVATVIVNYDGLTITP